MKTKVIFFAMLTLAFYFTAKAAVYTVNNMPGTAANFTNFNDAQTAANAGDTLYIAGSNTSYGSVTISKKLVIIGPGYLHAANYPMLSGQMAATFESTTIQQTALGTVIIGMTITSGLYINADNVIIMRSKFNYPVYAAYSRNINNLMFIQNYFPDAQPLYIGGSYVVTNAIVSNNIIYRAIANASSTGIFEYNVTQKNTSADRIELYNFVIRNNVVHGSDIVKSLASNSVYNNFCSLATGNYSTNNTYNFSYDDNLQGPFLSTTLDYAYKNKPTSALIGAAHDGGDAGLFGGSTPYQLSGLPPMPIIVELDADKIGNAETGLKVKVKAISVH